MLIGECQSFGSKDWKNRVAVSLERRDYRQSKLTGFVVSNFPLRMPLKSRLPWACEVCQRAK